MCGVHHYRTVKPRHKKKQDYLLSLSLSLCVAGFSFSSFSRGGCTGREAFVVFRISGREEGEKEREREMREKPSVFFSPHSLSFFRSVYK